MKTNRVAPVLAALSLIGLAAFLNEGCQKKEISESKPPASESKSVAFVSAEKTSFAEATSQLDPGGNFYAYLGTAQWLDGLSAKISNWRQTFTNMPDIKPDDLDKVNKAFDVVTQLVKDSGVEDISGIGLSSIEIEKGFYRNKMFMHHYPGKNSGFLWKMAGKEPHALTGLDLLPTDTALAVFSDTDLPLLWSVAKDEVAKSDIPQAQQWLDKVPDLFEAKTKVNWDQFLKSLGGEFGLALTLDESNNVPIPLPSGQAVMIPSPRLMIVVKVNDDTIFNRIDRELKKNKQVVSVDQVGLKMRTVPLPLPIGVELRPTAASDGGYLFIASSDSLIQAALAVKGGKTPGLKSTAEFKHLSQNIPDQGNQFTFMSQRFGETLYRVQQQMMAVTVKNSPAQAEWVQSFFKRYNRPAFAYSVGINTDQGCLTVGNGNQSAANLVLMPAIAVPGMLAAIAIPNFVKARTTAQMNACINNLRQLDAAKEQWALEKEKKPGDLPTKEDLLPYLRHWPACPQGGIYTIGPVGERPTCSIPGHQLP